MTGLLTPRLLAVTAASAALACGLMLVGILAGSSGVTPGEVLRTVFVGGDPGLHFIVFELRMPRVIAAMAVGFALGVGGALTQTFSRNPLATPDILGVTSGAAAGAVAVIVAGGGTYAVGSGLLGFGLPAVAIIGGLLTAAVVYGLSWRSGVDSYRLILIGIGATASLTGLTSYLVVKAQLTQAAAAQQWLVGSLSGVSWTSVWPVLLCLGVFLPIALTQTLSLEVSQLGDEMAAGLGVGVQRHRLIVIACAVVLTAVAVSASGPITFVAFVAPQVAQRLARSTRPPTLAAGCIGAVIVVGADIAGRTLLPWPVPVGIITAIVGAPYLIWLLTRSPKGASA